MSLTRTPASRKSFAVPPVDTSSTPAFSNWRANSALIARNRLVFLAMVLGHVSPRYPGTDQLIRWGADSGEHVILHHQWWRVVTSAVVHIGVVHLLMNMWALWVIGTLAETVLGVGLYLGVYIVCAIAGSLSSLYWHPAAVG